MLEDDHEREGDWRERRLALNVIEVSEVKVVELRIERVADQAVGAIGLKMGGASGGDFGRHLARRLRCQTHCGSPVLNPYSSIDCSTGPGVRENSTWSMPRRKNYTMRRGKCIARLWHNILMLQLVQLR